MHVGVLAAVREQRFPVAARLICVETVFLRPKALFHEIESLFEIFLPLTQACTERVGVREKNKGEPIAMVDGIFDLGFAFEEPQYPSIAAGGWIAMHIAKEGYAVFHPLKVLLPVKVLIGHRIGKHKSCTADQVTRNGVIDGTVIFEVMVKPSSRIDGTRMVEPHGMLYMPQQKLAAAEGGGGSGGHKNPYSLRRR
jgi:hypothetical protein